MDHPAEQHRQLNNAIRVGTVHAVDTAVALCRVQSGEILSDWIPWFVPRAGDVIEWSAPCAGEQVVMLCQGGDTVGAIALRGIYSNQFAAPSAEAGTHLVRYADGTVTAYNQDAHALDVTLADGGTVSITADGGVTINGDVTINGNQQVNGDIDLTGTATASVDVFGGGKSLKTHKHLGVTSGSSVSGPPA